MITRKKPMTNLEIRRSMISQPDYKVPTGYVICQNDDCLRLMDETRTVCFMCGDRL